MPVGIIVDALSVALGGILGAAVSSRLQVDFKDKLNLIFGICSMAMGINSIVLMKNMPAVVFSVIIGTAIGLSLHLGDLVDRAAFCSKTWFTSRILRKTPQKETGGNDALLVTAIVLFCASGTGVYGALISGMNHDHSILISKAVLDLFTAMIFACSLGIITSLIAIPQFILLMILFCAASVIFPLTTSEMIADFKACGGIIMLATGFRIMKVKQFPIVDMLPAMILVMPISHIWSTYLLPFLS